MNVTDSKQIVQRIKSKLIHALGTTIGEATNDEIYKAAAECIREDIRFDTIKHNTCYCVLCLAAFSP